MAGSRNIDLIKMVEDIFAPAQRAMDEAKKSLADCFEEVEKQRDIKKHTKWQKLYGQNVYVCPYCYGKPIKSYKRIYDITVEEKFVDAYRYCPRCGADMRGEE